MVLMVLRLIIIGLFLGWRKRGISTDLLMCLAIQILQGIRSNVVVEIFGKLAFIFLLIILFKSVHVLRSANKRRSVLHQYVLRKCTFSKYPHQEPYSRNRIRGNDSPNEECRDLHR